MVANSVVIVDAEEKYVSYIADNLQALDREEVIDNIADGENVKKHLINGIRNSEYNKVVISKGKVCALIGCKTIDFRPFGAKVGYLYTLTTKNLTESKFGYLKVAQRFVSDMLEQYDVLAFCVLSKYKASIKAVQILGFKPFRSIKLGNKDNVYIEFLLFKDKKNGYLEL